MSSKVSEVLEEFQPNEFLYSDEEDNETGAKVSTFDELVQDDNINVQKSSLRVRNVDLLGDVDTRYSGTKVSRQTLLKQNVTEGSEVEGSESDSDLSDQSDVVLNDSMESGSDIDEIDDVDESFSQVSVKSHTDTEKETNYEEDEDSVSHISKESYSNSEMEDDDDDKSSIGEGSMKSHSEDSEEDDIETVNISERDKKLEIDKGRAVQHQLRIFDILLEVRIRLQKILLDSNKLPQNEVFETLMNYTLPQEEKSEDFVCTSSAQGCQSSLKSFLNSLTEFQDAILNNNSDTKVILSGKRKHQESSKNDSAVGMDEEITSSDDEATGIDKDLIEMDDNDVKDKNTRKTKTKTKRRRIEEYETDVQNRFKSFSEFRNQTIQKWNEKTQVATGKMPKKNFTAFHSAILKQIQQILADKERLVKRTQLKRSQYDIIGKEVEEEEGDEAEIHANSEDLTDKDKDNNYDVEIFDDDDFYHQLLRELIERKTSNVTDSTQLSRHWLELQKFRSKMKRKIDTKASKGRKIRYEIHSKLVNFMAPYDNCPMSDNAIKELYSSLFGNQPQQVDDLE